MTWRGLSQGLSRVQNLSLLPQTSHSTTLFCDQGSRVIRRLSSQATPTLDCVLKAMAQSTHLLLLLPLICGWAFLVEGEVVLVYSIQRHGARNVLPKSATLSESDSNGGPTLLPEGQRQAWEAGEGGALPQGRALRCCTRASQPSSHRDGASCRLRPRLAFTPPLRPPVLQPAPLPPCFTHLCLRH